MWDTAGVLEEKRGRENILRKNGWKLPNLMEDFNICIQHSVNSKKDEFKENALKHNKNFQETKREFWKQFITYEGSSIILKADLSSETLVARRQQAYMLKMLKEKNHRPRILNPANLSFNSKGGIMTFPGKQKLRESSWPLDLPWNK